MNAFVALLRSELKVLLRDRTTLLLTFLLPLVFILIFGFVMGGEGGRDTVAGLVLAPNGDAPALREVLDAQPALRTADYADEDTLRSALREREVDLGLLWDGRTLSFVYDPGRIQEQPALTQIAQGITADFDLQRQGLDHVVNVERLHVGREAAANWLNMTVPAIIAFSILSAGMFAVAGHITAMKERKILDRLTVSPMPPLSFLLAVVCVRMVVVYISTLVTLFTAIAVFRVDLVVDWPRYTLFVAVATVGMMGFGALITLLVRRPSSASNLAEILAMGMMFLSGIFFPMEIMPGFLQTLSRALPLTYMAEALRYTTGVVDMPPGRFLAITAALAGLALVLLPALSSYVVRPQRR